MSKDLASVVQQLEAQKAEIVASQEKALSEINTKLAIIASLEKDFSGKKVGRPKGKRGRPAKGKVGRPKSKGRRGRPKGSKNKPKDVPVATAPVATPAAPVAAN